LYPNVNAIAIPDLRECNFGAFEEKSAKDLEGDPEFEAWIAQGMSVAAPNGESGVEFIARTCAAFESIVTGMMKTGTESAVIVCHGGSIMSILSQFGLPKVPFHEWIVGNGQGYSIMIHPRLWMADRVFEIYDKIPSIEQADSDLKEEERMSDLAREAAHKAFNTDSE
jgi:alpha-ribazole phosphatase